MTEKGWMIRNAVDRWLRSKGFVNQDHRRVLLEWDGVDVWKFDGPDVRRNIHFIRYGDPDLFKKLEELLGD